MPPRSRDRGRPVVLDDLFEDVVEIDHGEEDDSEEEEDDEGGEETDDDQGSEDGEGSSEEEEEEDEEGERHADFAGGDCGPSAQARVSGAAADCPVLQHDKLFEEMTKRQIAMEQTIKDAVSSKRQTPLRPVGSGKLGHHALIRRTGISSFAEGTTCYGNVSEIRMSRSAIIPSGDNRQEKLFAYGDESLRGVRTWQLPSFAIHSDLCPHRQPILDLRYAESSGGGTRYLGCLSDEKLQVFRVG
nr:unnamed protein product [Digitaria exilis]